MAVFKCKMCGGSLEVCGNQTTVTCEYCGTKQTLPRLDDERRANLYDRANHFRRNDEFDKAMATYEKILNEDNTDAEAYWSLVLCRYGIEYVEDPATRRRVPTVNRTQFTSIFDDEDYKSALRCADGAQRRLYEQEAQAINEIQKGILAISQQEEPFDIFICYKETDHKGRRTPDSVLAKEEPGLAQKIKNFLKQFTEALRKVFSGIKAAHYEAEVMAGHFEELQKMWENALVSATGNYARKGKANSTGKGLQYSDRDGTVKSASELTESDFYNLLERVENREFSLDTYIPIRATTPQFFIDVVREHSNGKIAPQNLPMAASVRHIIQNMEEEDGQSYGSERPHGLSKEDLVRISKEMGHPSYIVKQKNGRYAEIVSFYHSRNKKVVVAVDFAADGNNYKYSDYMNGYNDGYYNVVVTQYEPDDLQGYLRRNEVVYDKTKMNGRYQVGSGRIVAFTHDTPFIESRVSQNGTDVNGAGREDDGNIRYSQREYSEQVDEVKNNTHDPNNHVYMGTTPTSLANILGLPKLPMLITAQHVYSMAVSEQQAKQEGRYKTRMNYHALGWDTVKKLPEYINRPAMIVKSNTDPSDARFVVVTGETDQSGQPVIAAIQPNGTGNYFNLEIPSNFMLSSYGKDRIQNYINKAKNENRILYVDKKNSQKLKNTPGVQFADIIPASDYTQNLTQFKRIVKSKFAGTIFANSGLPQFSMREDGAAQERDYSYEALVQKPDMQVTPVDDVTNRSRADVVAQAKENAARIGKADPKTGSVSVYVKDIGTDVVLATNGLRHSLDRRFDVNAPVILNAGEILSNSIRINEIAPKKAEASESYVLIGAARNADGELYVVRSVVNRFSNEVMSMDVLYAMNAKKEPAALLPRLAEESAIRTDSTISIRELLDHVNRYFPDILPESVLRHYGYDARPAGILGESALFQEREYSYENAAPSDFYSNGRIYDYDFLTAQEPIAVIDTLPPLDALKTDGRIDFHKVVEMGLQNVLDNGGRKSGDVYFLKNRYTGRELQIGANSITHGLGNNNVNSMRTNARLGAVIGDICQNALPINGLPNTHRVRGTYVMAVPVETDVSGTTRQMIAVVTVEQWNSRIQSINYIDVAHALSGRFLNDTEKENRSAQGTPARKILGGATRFSTISIPDFLRIVNSTHQGFLSDDVIEKLGESRRGPKRGLFQEREYRTTDRDILVNLSLDSVSSKTARNIIQDFRAEDQKREALLDERASVEREMDGEKKNSRRYQELKNRLATLDRMISERSEAMERLAQRKAAQDVLKGEREYLERRLTTSDDWIGAEPGRYDQGFESGLDARHQRWMENLASYQGMVSQYGAIPKGENPARNIRVPRMSGEGQKVSQLARTIAEAGVSDSEAVYGVQEAIQEGKFSHAVITDKAAKKRAEDHIKGSTIEESESDFYKALGGAAFGKDDVALGFTLYNHYVQNRQYEKAVKLMADMSERITEAAQAVQAVRILKQLSPEYQVIAARRSIRNLQDYLNRRYGDRAPVIDTDDVLVQNFLNAKTEEEVKSAQDALYKQVAAQVPRTFLDKWNAWRYLAMLANPRTHIRNISGNLGFVPVRMAKDTLAAALESAYSKIQPGTARTKSIFRDKALVELARDDYDKVSDVILGAGKYSDVAGELQKYIPAFGTGRAARVLNAVSDTNSNLMEREDAWFCKPAYVSALSGYLTANHITREQFEQSEEIRAEARGYAIREAQRATYRDYNNFSNFIASLGRGRANNTVERVAGSLMEGVLPFRRTPANILVRTMEYFPAVGPVRGIYQLLVKVRTGEKTAAEALDTLSAGLVGTGLAALGLLLFQQGILTPPDDEDEKRQGFEELRGGQSYSLKIGDRYFSIDWLAPEALPLFMGAELGSLKASEEGGLSAVWDGITRITEPMLEMSMLSSLEDLLANLSYADTDRLWTILASSAIGYLTQGVPTLFGQIERTAEDRRYAYFGGGESEIPSDIQYAVSQIMNKLPGEYRQIPYIDAWGREEPTGNILERAINNFLNPSYVSTDVSEPFEDEIQRLYDSGETSVIPTRPSQSTSINGEKLTKDEFVEYSKVRGTTQYEVVKSIIESEWYDSLSDSDKAGLISNAYEYANAIAKKAVRENYEMKSWISNAKDALDNIGLPVSDFIYIRNIVSEIDGKNEEGESVSNLASLRKMNIIYSIDGITDEQKEFLYDCLNVAKSVRDLSWDEVKTELRSLE